jgi:hypothetical protein
VLRLPPGLMLAITLTGTLSSVDVAQDVMGHLREAAIAAGCPRERVRIEMRWQGRERPMELTVWCAEARGADEAPGVER